jgi:pyridoxine 5-phosphate synthase
LKDALTTKLNLEMGNTEEILHVALKVKPHDVCLVPENRHEITTEGGLDCVACRTSLSLTIAKLQGIGSTVSLFIDPDPVQIRAAVELKAEFIELHTGAFANATGSERVAELRRLADGALLAYELGVRVNAGHGLNYLNVHEIFAVPHLEELNIGHAIISRALVVGLSSAVAEMKTLCKSYRG